MTVPSGGSAAVPPDPLSSRDAVWVGVLAATAIVIGLPILQGGYRTYLDNPVHLTELVSLGASQTGWSDAGFGGFPLDSLHSPLWYGALSRLARAGLPVAPFYCAALFAGLLAPAVALHFVGRRELPLWGAATLSYAILVMRPAVVGTESAFGGMWTAGLALAGVLLVTAELAASNRTAMSSLRLATLVGLIGLTHLFAIVALVVLFAIHTGLVLAARKAPWRTLFVDAGAALVGALASARYWLPLFTERTADNIVPQNLGVIRLIDMFVFAGDFLPRLAPDISTGQMLWTDKLPGYLIVGLGLASLRRLGRSPVGLAHYGLLLAGAVGLLLAAVAGSRATFLGPVSWRFLRYVHLGLALAGIVTLARLRISLPARATRAASFATVSVVAVALGLWWGRPLRAIVMTASHPDLADVRSLWSFLRENRSPDWGRVYLQDTFFMPFDASAMAKSHILALTTVETGVEQIGTYYGVVPFRTRWTLSEFGAFRAMELPVIDSFAAPLDALDVGVVVVSDPPQAAVFERHAAYRRLFAAGRFTVFQRIRKEGGRWAESKTTGAMVRMISRSPGALRLEVSAPVDGAAVAISESWHPSWQLQGPAPATIEQDRIGLLGVTGIPAGTHRLTLDYRPSRWPLVVSVIGWVILAVGWAAAGRRSRSERAE